MRVRGWSRPSAGPRWVLPALVIAACSGAPADGYQARGTVELPEVDVAAMQPARVVVIRVDEGDVVRAGDTLALLTQTDLGASLAGQRARLASAEANLRDLEAGSRPEEIARAEAELASAQAEVERAGKELQRVRDLAARDVVSRQSLDNAVAAERVARGRMQSADEALRLLRAGSRPERIRAARAEVATARAALAQLDAHAADLVLTAPVAGTILGRHAEPGEALAATVPVVTVGETARAYVRVFVPQGVVTGLRVGAPAEVVTGDGRRIEGSVVAINPKAEFTPKVALTERERADLMFGVKVEFARPAEAPQAGIWVGVRVGGQADRRTGGPADRRTGGRADRRTGGQADRRNAGKADSGSVAGAGR
ncbi:MAG TPA: HlyD family efflux transporter periplasmic adaptor subunit [Gemmatimonadales bacterium]|nr:HlyD family efflux transporter periplasmic adaptor subunit [Gemmatimonadales bacterium]